MIRLDVDDPPPDPPTPPLTPCSLSLPSSSAASVPRSSPVEEELPVSRAYERGVPRGGLKLLREQERQGKAAERQARGFEAMVKRREKVNEEEEVRVGMLRVREERIVRSKAVREMQAKDKGRERALKQSFRASEVRGKKKMFEAELDLWAAEQVNCTTAKLEGVSVITKMKEENRSYHERAMILTEKEMKEDDLAASKKDQKIAFESFSEGRKQLGVLEEIGKQTKIDKDRTIHKIQSDSAAKISTSEQRIMAEVNKTSSAQSRSHTKVVSASREAAASWAASALSRPTSRPPKALTATTTTIAEARYRSLTSTRYTSIPQLPEELLDSLDSSPPVCKKKWK